MKGRKEREEKKEKGGKREKASEEIDRAAVPPHPPPAYVAYFLQTAVPLVVDSGTQERKPRGTGRMVLPKVFAGGIGYYFP